jgi:F-type H+-transporting ATPase subunit b
MADIVLAQAETGEHAAAPEHGASVLGGAVELAEEHGEHAVGMPQLDVTTFPNQIFWLVLTLVAIYMILNRVALPRIAAVLSERQGTITNDIASAEELRLKAKEAEAAYDKALAEARAEAQRIAQAARDDIKADLAAAIARADTEISERTAESEGEIAAIRDEATASVRQVARDAAEEIVRMLGVEPSAAAVEKAVEQRLGDR